jgi:hypothetical protein
VFILSVAHAEQECLRFVGGIDIPNETTRSLAATFHLNHVASRSSFSWDDAASAINPDAQVTALATLHSLCLSHDRTIAAFAGSSCLSALVRMLARPPTSRHGFPSWHALLALLRHAMAGNVIAPRGIMEVFAAIVPAVVSVVARWSPGSRSGSQEADIAV